MKTIEELKQTPHLSVNGRMVGRGFSDEDKVYHGLVSWPDFTGSVIWGYNESGFMEHVSIRPARRKTPTWEIMCRIKDLFFYKDEMVVQIHPSEDRYFHGLPGMTNVLHLWRPMDGNFEILNHPELWD